MIRAGLEDRIQIDRINAKALQVVELILNALEVAAEELRAVFIEVRPRLARVEDRFVPYGVSNGRLVAVEGRAARGRAWNAIIVCPVAIAEAVREYLIDVRILQPLGRLESRVVSGDLESGEWLVIVGRAL